MPIMLEAVKSLLTEVKNSFGDHGEISNPEHPLHRPVTDLESAVAEVEQLTQDRPVTPATRALRNPSDLCVTLERPRTGLSRDVQFRFNEDGVRIVVVDTTQSPEGSQGIVDEREFSMEDLLTADGSLSI